jgi:hypothetical protein
MGCSWFRDVTGLAGDYCLADLGPNRCGAASTTEHDDSVLGKDSSPGILSPERKTLTGDWFGQGSARRDHDVDLRLEWAPVYQGTRKFSKANTLLGLGFALANRHLFALEM